MSYGSEAEVHMAGCWVWRRRSYRHLERHRESFYLQAPRSSPMTPMDSCFLRGTRVKNFLSRLLYLFQRLYVAKSAQFRLSLVEMTRGCVPNPPRWEHCFPLRVTGKHRCVPWAPPGLHCGFLHTSGWVSLLIRLRKKIVLSGFLGWAADLTRKSKAQGKKFRSWHFFQVFFCKSKCTFKQVEIMLNSLSFYSRVYQFSSCSSNWRTD